MEVASRGRTGELQPSMKWVVATRNQDKLREIRTIFADLPITLLDLKEFPHIGTVEETGTTLQENALLKARTVHQASGYPAIADDTGLEVDALGGAPGIYAARFAGPEATYRQNQDQLLTLMQTIPPQDRTARFRTCAAYVDGSQEIVAEGVVEGHITHEPLGNNGFGYDPVFLVEDTERTFGQMTHQEKQGRSHRARAFKALYRLLARSLPLIVSKETLT